MSEESIGENRPYDYITVEEYEQAVKTLDKKEKFVDLTQAEIVVLRHQFHEHGLFKDIVDVKDRLSILRCLLFWLDVNKGKVDRDTVFRDELEKRWPSEEVLFDSFKNEWSAVPSQDNEGWVPDRGGFKAGWFCLERWLKQKLLEKR